MSWTNATHEVVYSNPSAPSQTSNYGSLEEAIAAAKRYTAEIKMWKRARVYEIGSNAPLFDTDSPAAEPEVKAPHNPYESEVRLLKVTKIIQFLDECAAAGKLQAAHLREIRRWQDVQWDLVCLGAGLKKRDDGSYMSMTTCQMVCERILARLHWANADRTVAVGAARNLKVVEYAKRNS